MKSENFLLSIRNMLQKKIAATNNKFRKPVEKARKKLR